MSAPITCTVILGGRGQDFTPIQETLKWSTASVGGYASATFSVGGDQRRKFPYLGLVRIMLGPRRLWEGQIEDTELVLGDGTYQTAVTCFGLQRLLAENTVRAIYSKRNMGWGSGPVPQTGASGGFTRSKNLNVATGNYDPTDMTKTGVQVAGNGTAIVLNEGDWVEWFAPIGLTITRLMCTLAYSGANAGIGANKLAGFLQDYAAGWGGSLNPIAAGAVNQALRASANAVRLGGYGTGGVSPGATDLVQFSDVRVLGTSVIEDAADGFYGGTLLNQLVGLCPGLTLGIVEAGSDYTIQALERSVRDSVLSAVQEVAAYYTREWAVWDDGVFQWTTKQLDQAQWIVRTDQMMSMNLRNTIDSIGKQIIVLYSDAATGLDAEATAVATAQRNPYVKQGRAKDVLVKPSFPMTSNTSAQLAATLISDAGAWVPVTGTVVVAASTIVSHAAGVQLPACALRAGDNLLIPDLPKTELFASGRDGETLFHIVSSETDLDAGTVTLELEGQTNRADVILAQLAAVSRTITG